MTENVAEEHELIIHRVSGRASVRKTKNWQVTFKYATVFSEEQRQEYPM